MVTFTLSPGNVRSESIWDHYSKLGRYQGLDYNNVEHPFGVLSFIHIQLFKCPIYHHKLVCEYLPSGLCLIWGRKHLYRPHAQKQPTKQARHNMKGAEMIYARDLLNTTRFIALFGFPYLYSFWV